MWSRQYPVALLSVKPLQARPDRGDTRLKEVVKLSQQKKGRERNTRVGIVGFLTVQPEQLPVICFVVNAESLGDMSDRAGGISCRLSSDRCCVHGLVSDWVWLHMECVSVCRYVLFFFCACIYFTFLSYISSCIRHTYNLNISTICTISHTGYMYMSLTDVKRWRGWWWWCCSWTKRLPNKRALVKCETTRFLQGDVGIFSSRVCGARTMEPKTLPFP